MKVNAVVNVSKFLTSFHIATEKQKRLAEKGLLRGGLFLQRVSVEVCPRDTGNLAASVFTRKVEGKKTPTVEVGYAASYGIFVHENKSAKHAEGKKAKFLEEPARDFAFEIKQIIANTIIEGMR